MTPTIAQEVSVTGDVEIDFEVYCARCNAGLCNNTEVVKTYNRRANRLDIEPCEKCLEAAKDEGFDEGKEEARKESAAA